MASVVLTQVYLAVKAPVDQSEPLYVAPGSGNPLAIDQSQIIGVGVVYNLDGTILDARQVYVTGLVTPIYVADSYATVKGYIDLN
jgi:hypothetical protein